METVLLDEKEMNEYLVSKVKEMNNILYQSLNNEIEKKGIHPNSFIGGLQGAMCYVEMDLKTNIKNLIAAFSINFGESIGYQADNMEKQRNLNLILDYLQDRELERDFQIYKRSKGLG